MDNIPNHDVEHYCDLATIRLYAQFDDKINRQNKIIEDLLLRNAKLFAEKL